MKRFILALLAVVALASTVRAQTFPTYVGEYTVPFRATGLGFSNTVYTSSGTVSYTYSDTSWTSRGGAAWGATVNTQTDTTVWVSLSDLQDWVAGHMRSAAAVGDSVNAFEWCFVPDPAGPSQGLTAGADTVYVTFQGTNDGGQNIFAATREDQLVNPTSSNGFTRTYNTQTMLALFKSASMTPSNFLQFKQFRWIISSDINGRYVLSLRYLRLRR